MNKVSISTYIYVLTLFLFKVSAQEVIIYQPEEMQADLIKFKNTLIQIHPGTYTHHSPDEFEHIVNNLLKQASVPLEATEFYKLILKLIASIHDGHTQAYTFGKLGSRLSNQKRVPFQVHVQSERIFIVKNLSDQEIPQGSEIIALDGHLSNEILSNILKHYSSDGESHSGIYHWLGGPYRPFSRVYPEVFGEQSSLELIYRDRNTKKVKTTTIVAIPKKVYEKRESERYSMKETSEEAFHFEADKNKGYAYMKINRFFKDSFDEPENTYPDFYQKCFKQIFESKIETLIIDLRDNGGGKASNAAYLLQYLVDHSITPAEKISTLVNDDKLLKLTGDTLNLDDAFGLERTAEGRFKVTRTEVLRDLTSYAPIKEYAYRKKLIVLINGGTASAAGIAAGFLREYTQATFVGQETYGYAGISNGIRNLSVKGDDTETAIYLPLLHAEYSMNEVVQKRSVAPDYQISNTMQDILNNKDVILNYVHEKLLPTNAKNP